MFTNSAISKAASDFDNKTDKKESSSIQSNAPALGNCNPTKILVTGTSCVEPQFTSEMLPHVTSIQQMGLVKKIALNPITNMPLSLPSPISPVSTMAPDLIDPAILTLLNSELARNLATGSSTPSIPQYVRQGKYKELTESISTYS